MELLRRVVLNAGVLPLFRRYIRLTPRGQEHLSELCPPVIFAANHVSHLDTLAVLGALPKAWRKRLSPAMSWDYFLDHSQAGRGWARRLKMSGQYYTACTLLQAYPISQNREGLRRTLRYSGRLMDQGRCPLLYPEGRRSPHGRLLPFQSGVGYMALRLEAPVVPIYLEGMYEIYSIHHDWPDSGEVRVRIGPALHFDCGRDYLGATRSIEKAFRRLQMEG